MREKNKPTKTNFHASDLRGHKLVQFSIPGHVDEGSSILEIKKIIDETTDTIFSLHKQDLMKNPITYIIPAVWGRMGDSELNPKQKNIFSSIESMVNDVIDIMEFDELSDSQRFSIEYLIRGLVISKITYLIASSRTSDRDLTCS